MGSAEENCVLLISYNSLNVSIKKRIKENQLM